MAISDAAKQYDKLYSYRIPDPLVRRVLPGCFVLVPFGRADKPRLALVLAVCEGDPNANLKTLLSIAPDDARIPLHLLNLVQYLKDRTFCTWFDAVNTVIPYGAQYQIDMQNGHPALKERLVQPVEKAYERTEVALLKPLKGKRQIQAISALENGSMTQKQLQSIGISKSTLDALCEKGILRAVEQSVPPDLGLPQPLETRTTTLSAPQQSAYNTLLSALLEDNARFALLYGVTGSGKTAVFEELIHKTLALGRKVLVLVPEIGLTVQMLQRLRARFASRLAVQHSGLNRTERLMQWQRIRRGEADVVVGTRSAVFAPLENLGLIVIDEEQEHTYQSETSPRYDARAVAARRALQDHALLVLSSATPRTETWYAAQTGKIERVELHERYAGRPLPKVDFIDMRQELVDGNPHEISIRLAEELRYTISRKEQALLLLNRRGYHTVAQCVVCRKVMECPNCSVPMVYHKSRNVLLCHHCGHLVCPPPVVCPVCGGRLAYSGFGTQRVEEELAQLLPQARILRMDQDSTGRKNAYTEMITRFANGDYDILLGTQMVAKGLDFEKITLVGVLGIDSLLFGQGFRSYENVFGLITQVVGRGGRAETAGRALIQTTAPNHPILRLAADQNYPAFYKEEIQFRRYGLYPPFCAFCVAGFSGTQKDQTLQAAQRFETILADFASQNAGIPLRILGPVPMNIAMLNSKYRYKVTVKCRNDATFRNLLRQALAAYEADRIAKGISVALDFNCDGDL